MRRDPAGGVSGEIEQEQLLLHGRLLAAVAGGDEKELPIAA